MPNDDTDGGPSTRWAATTDGGAVVVGRSGTDTADVPTARAGAGGPALDRRRVTVSDR
ncbi:hypothetical protein [Haloplanus rubicundus]|uniref:hypothetical protein n=1 Tax=Haloplanus rubicundus TaxID=1547898 RepID=UPI001300A336|nr:hypothetical protein [Haloplanus rubicundus]